MPKKARSDDYWVGREYRFMRIIAPPFEVGTVSRHVKCICLGKEGTCGKEVIRNLQSLIRTRGGAPCNECRNVGVPQAHAHEQRRIALTTDLTDAEKAQIDRIVKERRVYDALNRLEAIQCVIADRRTKEMLCHGGEEWTI